MVFLSGSASVAIDMRRVVLSVLSLRAASALQPRPRALPPSLQPRALPPARTALAAAPALLLLGATPAFAKGAAVPFTLLGRSSAALFPLQNLALLPWALYVFRPRWKRTKQLALVSPLVHAALYTLLLLHLAANPVGPPVDFSSLKGVMSIFASADGAFAGWLHYVVFDPLVGLGIVLDAKAQRVKHWLCVPCLALTCLAGPAGFLAYMALRTATLALRAQGIATRAGVKYTRPAKKSDLAKDWSKPGFTGDRARPPTRPLSPARPSPARPL